MTRSRWLVASWLLAVSAVAAGCAHHPHLGTGMEASSTEDDSLLGSLLDPLLKAGTAGRPVE